MPALKGHVFREFGRKILLKKASASSLGLKLLHTMRIFRKIIVFAQQEPVVAKSQKQSPAS